MKLHYFFGCTLAAASLAVWPEIGLAHGAEVVLHSNHLTKQICDE